MYAVLNPAGRRVSPFIMVAMSCCFMSDFGRILNMLPYMWEPR
jgi:hypothetical protein